jgi:acetylornithine deacetylase
MRIVLTADEEIGCIGAGHLLGQDLIRPANMVVGEPTNMQPARAGKGYCMAKITVTGHEAHSAHPLQGASAILGAAHLMVALEELAALIAREENPLFSPGYTTMNIGTIQGGTAKNIIPGECSFLLEWRPIPSAGATRIPEQINQVIDRQRQIHPRLSYHFDITRKQSGFETAADSTLVRAIESLSGCSASSIPFGSEASVFANVCHNVVVFGPGDMQTAHSSRECVPIDQLHRAVHCLRALMLTNQ